MTGRLYCIDNDIIQKLATFELFDETIKLLDVSSAEINILATAKYKFRKDPERLTTGRIRRPEAKLTNYKRIIELAETLPQIEQSEIDSNLFEQLSTLDGIDPGEAILTTHVAMRLQQENASEAFILTGDKRYLEALAQVHLTELPALFSHRFWCLEQLILRNIHEYGFEAVCDKIVPVRDCDKACKVVFGSGILTTEKNAIATLRRYVKDLRAETGNLLHPYCG